MLRLYLRWSHFRTENRFPPIAHRKTRVNALMIKSGAGFFLKMLYGLTSTPPFIGSRTPVVDGNVSGMPLSVRTAR